MNEIKYSKSLPEDFDLKKVYGVIYKITNLISNKVYIGQSINVKARFYAYRSLKCNTYLKSSILKNGLVNFEFEVIDFVMDKESLDKLEISYIEKFNSADRNFGYNIDKGGYSGSKMSDEQKQKLREINLGRKHSEETKAKMRKPKHTIEHKLKMHNLMLGNKNGLGYKLSEEHKEKLRLANLIKNSNKKLTEESIL